jgi:hypothetical protein
LCRYAAADFSPFAVRRAAFMDVGMLDEGMAPAGESGILSDYGGAVHVLNAVDP